MTADPRHSLTDIAAMVGGECRSGEQVEITGIGSLIGATDSQLSFLFSPSYRKYLAGSRAAAVVLRREDAEVCDKPVIICGDPRLAWAKLSGLFDPAPTYPSGVHQSAFVAASAVIGSDVVIGPNVTIEDGARIGNDCTVGAGSYIGHGSELGAGAQLHPNVVIYHGVKVGARANIHSAAVLGADGFGFAFDGGAGALRKIHQVYGVRVGDDVEIGAGTTIDRGALNDTVVGDGVKLDNQVQVGHGTEIGDHTAISGCTAIAGSTKIGSYCLIGGAVGIIDNIEICDRVEVTAMSLVSQSIRESGRYSSGTGLMLSADWKRNIVGFRRLGEILGQLRKVDRRLQKLES